MPELNPDPMDIGSLLERLQAAERALVVFGWCAIGPTERDEAALELWSRWAKLVPAGFLDRATWPDIDIDALVAARCATRERTLERLGLARES